MKTMTKKRIRVLKKGACKDMADWFGCSAQTISYALNFKNNSMFAKKIRHHAMNVLSGIIV